MIGLPENLLSTTSIVSSFAFGFAAAYFFKGNGHLGKLFSGGLKLKSGSEAMKMALVVRTDLKMGKGKVAAQCAHAAVSCFNKAMVNAEEFLCQWEAQGQTKIVLATKEERGLEDLAADARKTGLIAVVIHDAGHTQVLSGTATVVGIGPGPEKLVDQVVGHLKLY